MYAFQNITSDMNAVISFTDHNGKAQSINVSGSEFEKSGSMYVVYIDEIVVADGRQDVTVQVYDGETLVASATDSLESYIARMSNADPLYEMIMKFSDSAYAYLHE